jgi:hypothetical protein
LATPPSTISTTECYRVMLAAGLPPRERCVNCKTFFHEQDNHPSACRYHPGSFRTLKKAEASSGYISFLFVRWTCCRRETKNAPGCRTDWHILDHQVHSLLTNQVSESAGGQGEVEEEVPVPPERFESAMDRAWSAQALAEEEEKKRLKDKGKEIEDEDDDYIYLNADCAVTVDLQSQKDGSDDDDLGDDWTLLSVPDRELTINDGCIQMEAISEPDGLTIQPPQKDVGEETTIGTQTVENPKSELVNEFVEATASSINQAKFFLAQTGNDIVRALQSYQNAITKG